jgi:phage terminase large subunit-like protein
VDILEGQRVDPTFYPVVYGLKDDKDWEDKANWYKVNPSLGYTVDIERLRDAYWEAKQNLADEVTFKWLRLNMWVSSTVAWIPDAIFMKGIWFSYG